MGEDIIADVAEVGRYQVMNVFSCQHLVGEFYLEN